MENNNIIEQEITQPTSEPISTLTTEPANAQPQPPMSDKATKPASFGAFFGLIFLFAIPVIGWLACIICMFAPKNKSLKNYARAVFAWFILKVAIAAFVVVLLINILLPAINDAMGTQFNNVSEIAELVGDITTGNYAGIIGAMKPQLIDALGTEYEPIIDEMSKEDYNILINQIINGEYQQALSDIQADAYPGLQEVLGNEVYNTMTNELEAAANGEESIFYEIKEMIPSIDALTGMTSEEMVLNAENYQSSLGELDEFAEIDSNYSIETDGDKVYVDIG